MIEISSHRVRLGGYPITVTYVHKLSFGIPLFESKIVYATEKVTKEKKILGLKVLNSEAKREGNSSVWHETTFLFGLPTRKNKYEGSEEMVSYIEELDLKSIFDKVPSF
jgi:hypothetical protein